MRLARRGCSRTRGRRGITARRIRPRCCGRSRPASKAISRRRSACPCWTTSGRWCGRAGTASATTSRSPRATGTSTPAAGSSDTDDRRSLRATVIAALGTIGYDPDIIARARSAVDRALAGTAPLDPTLAGAVIKTAARHGNAALFEALLAAAERAPTPEEHYRYLYALADFREPALVERGLQLALSPQLRSQDTAVYLAQFFGNPDARSRALSHVTEHWTALAPKVTISGGDTNLIRSMSSFCDAQSRDQIKTFFAAHSLPAATRTLDQTLEQIDNCIVLREKQTPAVTDWLASR